MSWEDNSVRIWNAHDGSSRHVEQYDGKFSEFAVAISSGEIFYCDEDRICAINAYTLSKRESRGFKWLDNPCFGDFSLIGNHLLISVYPEDEVDDATGIYIVDVVTFEKVGRYAGNFRCFRCSEEGLLVAENHDGRLNVYQLNERDASMVPFRSFMRQGHGRNGRGPCLLVNSSKVYISAWARGPPFCTIDVYDTRNGSFLRSLCCPLDGHIGAPVSLVAGSKMLFCGFNSKDGSNRYARGAIKAYLLE